MNNIEKTQEDIIKRITGLVNSVFSEFSSVTSELEKAKNDLIDITMKYSDISNKISAEEEGLRTRERKISENESYIELELSRINNLNNAILNSKLESEEMLKRDIAKRDLIKSEIDSLIKEKESISFIENAKETLTGEVSVLKSDIIKLRNEQEKIKQDNLAEMEKFNSELKEKRSELEYLNSEIDKIKSVNLPKIKDIEEREAKLKEQEESMKTIINRYERLYSEKGVGFKI